MALSSLIRFDVFYTRKSITKQIKATTALEGTVLQIKTTRDTHFYSYSLIIKFPIVYSFSSTPRCILHRGDNFIFKYLHEYSAKIKIIPEYL